jgi:hypothetical protein
MSNILKIILCIVCYRLIPHPFNATPVVSISLFSGMLIPNRSKSLVIPLLCMLSSDIFLGFYSSQIFTYSALALSTCLGWLQPTNTNFKRIMVASATAALIFFVVSNIGVFLTTSLYPHSLQGLFDCYIAAIPFFENTLLATLGFSSVFYFILWGYKTHLDKANFVSI